jgi:hypothetical protein
MLAVKNDTGSEQIWGGMIFDNQQTRTIDGDDKKALSNDSAFYQCILAQTALVYVDEILIDNVILACEYIRAEMRRDEEGSLITKIRQVSDTYHRQQKFVHFTTSDSTSLIEKRWVNLTSNECSLSFYKIVNDVLTECADSEATVTKLLWVHSCKTMPNYAEIRLNEVNSVVTAYVGSAGYEAYDAGRIAYGISFAMTPIYHFEVVEPRLLSSNLVVYFEHTTGYQIPVEIYFEFFTNFEAN